jgi:hypothetical protein
MTLPAFSLLVVESIPLLVQVIRKKNIGQVFYGVFSAFALYPIAAV